MYICISGHIHSPAQCYLVKSHYCSFHHFFYLVSDATDAGVGEVSPGQGMQVCRVITASVLLGECHSE